MPRFSDKLRQNNTRKMAEQSPILNIRREIKNEVLRLFEQFRQEMEAEHRRMMEEKIGEGVLQLKGERGHTPKKGID